MSQSGFKRSEMNIKIICPIENIKWDRGIHKMVTGFIIPPKGGKPFYDPEYNLGKWELVRINS
jgi:hypothetical protein